MVQLAFVKRIYIEIENRCYFLQKKKKKQQKKKNRTKEKL